MSIEVKKAKNIKATEAKDIEVTEARDIEVGKAIEVPEVADLLIIYGKSLRTFVTGRPAQKADLGAT